MNLKLRVKLLRDIAVRLHAVGRHSRKGLRAVISITAENDRVVCVANGDHLTTSMTLTGMEEPCLQITETGQATVDSAALHHILNYLAGAGGDDHLVELTKKNGALVLRDTAAGSENAIGLTSGPKHTPITSPTGTAHLLPADVFVGAIDEVVRYQDKRKPKFQRVCIHVLPGEVRFVCGNGPRFAVMRYPSDPRNQEHTYLMPADQLKIIAKVIHGSELITLRQSTPTCVMVDASPGIQVRLAGIPELTYLKYAKHAWPDTPAIVVTDIPRATFAQAIAGLENDWQYPDCTTLDHELQPVLVNIGEKTMTLSAGAEQRKRVTTCRAAIHGRPATDQEAFHAVFHYGFLRDVAKAAHGGHVRIHWMTDRAIAEVGELGHAAGGLPDILPWKDGGDLRFFFGALKSRATADG